jgi:hypothetical protein
MRNSFFIRKRPSGRTTTTGQLRWLTGWIRHGFAMRWIDSRTSGMGNAHREGD